MTRRITATEAVRNFSELLNAVKLRKSHYTILRAGKPVATLGPVEEPGAGRTLGEFPSIFRSLPRLGKDAEAIDTHLKGARKSQPGLPRDDAWES